MGRTKDKRAYAEEDVTQRVGPYGLIQPIADGLKLLAKELLTPVNVDSAPFYYLAPVIVFIPVLVSFSDTL